MFLLDNGIRMIDLDGNLNNIFKMSSKKNIYNIDLD